MNDIQANSPAIPIVKHIAPISVVRSAWLVDIWGVMHNGVAPFDEAVAACDAFKAGGGIVLLLSNSPRLRNGVVDQLRQIGVPDTAYDDVVTSGDATRTLISAKLETPVFHLGPVRDRPTFAGLDVTFAEAGDAGVIVCTGLFDDSCETPDDYTALLEDFAGRGVTMICANPDLKVERGGQIIYCAGALAQRYGELGGAVALAGKPHWPIYQMAFERLAKLAGRPVAVDEVLAIGDGVKTDIAGACAVGVAAFYVASAVHMARGVELNSDVLDDLFPDPEARPIAATTALAW